MKKLKHIILIAASLWASAEAIDEAVVITPDEAMAPNFGPNHEYRFMNFLNLAVEQFSKRPSLTHLAPLRQLRQVEPSKKYPLEHRSQLVFPGSEYFDSEHF